MDNFSRVFIGVVIYISLQVVFGLLWGVTFLIVAHSGKSEMSSLLLFLGGPLSFTVPVSIAVLVARKL